MRWTVQKTHRPRHHVPIGDSSGLTCYSIWKTRWRVALFWQSLDDVRKCAWSVLVGGTEPLAGGWTAVENVCQRIREVLACSLYSNGEPLPPCAYCLIYSTVQREQKLPVAANMVNITEKIKEYVQEERKTILTA